MANKDSYLNKERKHNAEVMRDKGHGDVLNNRKSIGRHGEKMRKMAKKTKADDLSKPMSDKNFKLMKEHKRLEEKYPHLKK